MDSEEDIAYDDMNESQKREYHVNQFVKNLNQRKPHFENINQNVGVMPIVEATEVEEDLTSRMDSKLNTDRDGSKKSGDKPKVPGESMSEDEESPEGDKESDEKSSGDDESPDENSPDKKKKGKKSSDQKLDKLLSEELQDEDGSDGAGEKKRRIVRVDEEEISEEEEESQQ